MLVEGVKGKQIDAVNWYLGEPSGVGRDDEAIFLQGTSSTASKGSFSFWCAYFNSKKGFAESQVLTAVRVSKVDEQQVGGRTWRPARPLRGFAGPVVSRA